MLRPQDLPAKHAKFQLAVLRAKKQAEETRQRIPFWIQFVAVVVLMAALFMLVGGPNKH